MPQPPEYVRQYSFTGYSQANPSALIPGTKVDQELNAVKQTSDAIRSNLARIQRDDGALANDSVGVDQMKPEVKLGLNAVEEWTPGNDYLPNNGVWKNGKLYRCLAGHTSDADFAVDLAASRWSLLLDLVPWAQDALDGEELTFTGRGAYAVERSYAGKVGDIVNILDYVPVAEHAAIKAGTSTYDIADAIRKAIDSAGGSEGVVVQFPFGGKATVGSTVYIPPTAYGVTLELNRFTSAGGGLGTHTIFETGMGTTSVGGATNWNEPDETVQHIGLVIRNGNFVECGTAIKAFNALLRSEFSGNFGYTNCTKLLHLKRCFYSKTLSNHGILGEAGRADDAPIFHFEEVVNVQTIMGNSASGIYGGAFTTGIGFLFEGGVAGQHMLNNAAEGCKTGVKITGEIAGGVVSGFYFELDDVGLDLGLASKVLDVEGCFFFSNVTTAIASAGGWVAGKLAASNSIDPACLVDLTGVTNQLVIELQPQHYTMSGSYTDCYDVPPNWTISGAARIVRPVSAYDAAGSVGSARALLPSETNAAGLVALPFKGDVGGYAAGEVPFTFFFNGAEGGAGNLLFDTQIKFRTDNGMAQYDLVVTDSGGTHKIAGCVRHGSTVYPLDATGKSVGVSNPDGFMRFTISSFTNAILVSAKFWIA